MKQPEKRQAPPGRQRNDHEAIGARLRQLFDEVVNEPVPDEFLELLRRADSRTSPDMRCVDDGA
jgi:hypothetical protein